MKGLLLPAVSFWHSWAGSLCSGCGWWHCRLEKQKGRITSFVRLSHAASKHRNCYFSIPAPWWNTLPATRKSSCVRHTKQILLQKNRYEFPDMMITQRSSGWRVDIQYRSLPFLFLCLWRGRCPWVRWNLGFCSAFLSFRTVSLIMASPVCSVCLAYCLRAVLLPVLRLAGKEWALGPVGLSPPDTPFKPTLYFKLRIRCIDALLL